MSIEQYEYDVAFSFLSGDEPVATQLNDLLQDRLSTFLYSKRQGEIAGTDGEKNFNSVFGEKSRLVVVLYRVGWGETPWTRIEETAIRNRAYDEGYGFVIFIPLDDSPSVPKWLPRTQLWVGLKRWGPEGAAPVIEARVQELGGEPHEETVLDRAARLERSFQFAANRKQFLNSDVGVRAANADFDSLHIAIEQLATEVSATASSISLRVKTASRQIVILGLGLGLSVDWVYHYGNSLDDAKLNVVLWNGHPPFPGVSFYEQPKKGRTITFIFDLLAEGHSCWVSDGKTYSTTDLASFILKYFMEQAEAASKKGSR